MQLIMARVQQVFAILAMCCISIILAQADFELSIIHVNDIHARYEPVSEKAGTCNPEQNEQGLCYGGISRIVTMVTELKNTMVNPVLLNAGDVFQGSILYSLFKWNISATFMNRIPFDAMALGNHEFDDKIAGFAPYLDELKIPVVAANMDASSVPQVQGKYFPSVVIERGGRSIGIIGCITKYTPEMSSSESLIFNDELGAVSSETSRLHDEGVNILILLSHSGYDVDLVLAKQVPHLDVIVGAHSHSFLYTGSPPSVEVPVGEYPTVVTQDDVNRKVLVVQAYAYSKYVGVLSAHFDSQGEIVSGEGNPRLLDSSVKEDPETILALQPWVDEANVIGNVPLGSSLVLLDSSTCYQGECNLGSFLTEGMVSEQIDKTDDEESWTAAAIAIMNPGGLRAPLGESPEISFNDLVTSQPFANTIDTIELQGKDIVEILEMAATKSASYSTKDFGDGRGCMQVAGIEATYNMSLEAGSRVTQVLLRCAKCRVPELRAVQLEEWYNVAMPSFLSNGGDGFELISERGRNKLVGGVDVDVFSKFILKETPIFQGEDGRIKTYY